MTGIQSKKEIPFTLPGSFIGGIKKEGLKEFWLLFHDSELLVDETTMQPLQPGTIPRRHEVFVGTFEGTAIFAAECPSSSGTSLIELYGKMDDAWIALAGRALQLIHWDKTTRFCGQCGAETELKGDEIAKQCPSCRRLIFPKMAPVVMALITRGEEILLARGPHFPKPFYSILAGFVDPGETLERCVQREVFEEVGLKVDNIRYFASQAWPFPHSLMMGFTCRWVEGDIKMDPAEIADAGWFKKDQLPLLPPPISLAGVMIDAWINQV